MELICITFFFPISPAFRNCLGKKNGKLRLASILLFIVYRCAGWLAIFHSGKNVQYVCVVKPRRAAIEDRERNGKLRNSSFHFNSIASSFLLSAICFPELAFHIFVVFFCTLQFNPSIAIDCFLCGVIVALIYALQFVGVSRGLSTSENSECSNIDAIPINEKILIQKIEEID